jgi:tetratricopeptide (TPR) repeat protein
MNMPDRSPNRGTPQQLVALLLITVIVSACATTESARPPPTRIEVQDTVGFTITEDARVDNDTRAEYDRALRLLEQGALEPGIQTLEAVVKAAPELSAPLVDLGIAYHVAGKLDDAERSLLRALELNPDHPIALNELGIVYRKSGRFSEARKSYEASLAIYPGYHYARRNLAVLCDLYLADTKCALENYDAYMATVPSDEEASMWIKDLRYRIGQAE